MIDYGTFDPRDPRCAVCLGNPGDDMRRCERDALPLHQLHRIDGISYLVDNSDEINAAFRLIYELEGTL